MKVIMIYDQIQSGAGIKDDHMIPLGAKKRTGWTSNYDGTIFKNS